MRLSQDKVGPTRRGGKREGGMMPPSFFTSALKPRPTEGPLWFECLT